MSRLPSPIRLLQGALACLALAHSFAHAATFKVTNNWDNGPDSLRSAILAANAAPGIDLITFDIPGGAPAIRLITELPAINDVVIIDGYSQPGSTPNTLEAGFDANICVVVDGSASVPGGGVFNETYGFTFRKGAEGSVLRGVKVSGFSHGVVLANVDGVTIEGSKVIDNNVVQILATGNHNVIGLMGPSGRNLVAGPNEAITLAGEGNVVKNNYIGFAESIKETGVPNPGRTGVLAFFGYPIGVMYNSKVVSGKDLICQAQCGLAFQSNHHQIGGPEKGEGNVIVAQRMGVRTVGSSDETAEAVMRVQGNVIGAGFDGNRSRAYGNFYGVHLNHDGASSIRIEGNSIFDGEVGIVVAGKSRPVTGARIVGNRIVGHNAMAIDLGENGRDTNDPVDQDGGENNGQNFPVFVGPVPGGSWQLHSTPSQTFDLEFFQSGACKPAEADVFLGTYQVTTDARGDATFTGPLGALPGGFITATATGPLGNTSELSECAAAPKLKSSVEITSAKTGLMAGSWDSRFEMRVDGGPLFTPTGWVNLWFVDGSGARTKWLGSAFVNGNTAVWTDTNLQQPGSTPVANTPGAHRIQAEYVGDSTFDSSASSVVDYRVFDVKHTFTNMGVSDLLRANMATAFPDNFEILWGADLQSGVTDTWKPVGLAPGKRIVAAGKFVRGFGQALYLVADSAGNVTVEDRVLLNGPMTVRPVTGWNGGTVVEVGRFFKSHQQAIVVKTGPLTHEARLLPDTYSQTLPVVRTVALEPAVRFPPISSLSIQAVGDFDGDGNDDIIWEVDGALEMNLMDGAMARTVVPMSPPVLLVGGVPVTFSLGGVGDFDGDGRMDLVWVGGDSYYITLLDGGALKEPASSIPVQPIGSNWQLQAIADYDGDGKADLAWRWEVQGLNLITYMDGSGVPPRRLAVDTFLPLTTDFIDP